MTPQPVDPTLAQLIEELGVTPEAVSRRLLLHDIHPQERADLKTAAPQVEAALPGLIEDFYATLQATPSTRSLLGDATVVARLKVTQRRYLLDLTSADYDHAHAISCLRIGLAHFRVRLAPHWFVAAHGVLLSGLAHTFVHSGATAGEGLARLGAAVKAALFDAALVLEGYAMTAEVTSRAEAVTPQAQPHPAPSSERPGPSSGAPASLRTALGNDELAERLAFLGLTEADHETLHRLAPAAEAVVPRVVDAFYERLGRMNEMGPFVTVERVPRLKAQLRSYWREFFGGTFDRAHAASRSMVGVVHERLGLTAPHYLLGLSYQLGPLLQEVVAQAPDPAVAARAFLRAVFFDVSFVIEAYVKARASAVLRTDAFSSELLAGISSGVAIIDERSRVEVVNPSFLRLFQLDARLVRHAPCAKWFPSQPPRRW